MSVKRGLAAAIAAIVAFLALSLYAVDRMLSDPAPAATAGGGAAGTRGGAAVDPSSLGSAPPSTDLPAGLAGLSAGKPVVEVDAPPPPPPPGSWEAVPISARAAALGKGGPGFGRELNDLQPELGSCFGEEAQARHGAERVTAVRDASPQADVGATVMVLELESLNHAMRIVDVPVETRGDASDGLLACIQSKLRGRVLPAPGARAGERHRLLYTPTP